MRRVLRSGIALSKIISAEGEFVKGLPDETIYNVVIALIARRASRRRRYSEGLARRDYKWRCTFPIRREYTWRCDSTVRRTVDMKRLEDGFFKARL